MDARTSLGRTGEDVAARFFESRGFVVVSRNEHLPAGELDLVCRRGDLIVFCEVKTRRSGYFGEPSEAVGHVKQMRIKRLAAQWLALHRPGSVDIRFDVVSVIVRDGRTLIDHIPDAF
ncbi:MAG TPA: YraN family protein [Actinomycetota bacterium]|nr:YraN family protein [Actinomycetota bacterium]